MILKEMIYSPNRKIEILYQDKYENYQFYILNLGTHPTAYIEIPKDNKLYKKEYDEIDLNVHGGVTYSSSKLLTMKNSWFIGWDYSHIFDYSPIYEKYGYIDDGKKWTTKEVFEDVKDAIEQIIKINKGE